MVHWRHGGVKNVGCICGDIPYQTNKPFLLRNRVNPIGPVTNVLQDMAQKVAEKGDAEKVFLNTFHMILIIFTVDLTKDIEEDGGRIITETQSNIAAAQGPVEQFNSEVAQGVTARNR